MSQNAQDPSTSQAPIDHFEHVIPAHNFSVVCEKCNSQIDSNSAVYIATNTGLETFLKDDYYGKLIVGYYQVHNKLSEYYTNLLAEIVVRREIFSILKLKNVTTEAPLTRLEFPTSLLKDLAQQLSDRFGGRAAVYYSPGITEGTNRINPAGKLHNQVCYARKQLIESGLLVTTQKQNSAVVVNSSATKNSEEHLKVLSHQNFEDWDAVEQAWEASYVCRQQLRADKGDKLVEFGLFPCLDSVKAVSLINYDFTTQFKDIKPLNDSWKDIQPTLEEFILSKRIDNFRHTNSIEELLAQPNVDKDSVILSLLLDGIKSTTSSSIKRRKTDESLPIDDKKKAIKESFVVNVENAENLDEEIERRRNLIIGSKEAIYPYLVFVGPFASPTKFYVIVDKIKYSCVSAVEALDIAFKIFLTTTRPFPKQSWIVWLFIRKVGYRIKSTKEKSSVPLEKALSFIEEKLNIKLD